MASNEKLCQIWIGPIRNVCFCFNFIVCVHFSLLNFDFGGHSNKYFNIFWQKIYDVRFGYFPWKNVWFCFISSAWFHFSHKTEKFEFESHWNTLIIFDKKRDEGRSEYVSWKNVLFCFISIVLVHFGHKTEKFQLLKWLKYFTFFFCEKKRWCQTWICPVKQGLIWFRLRFLHRTLAISWEIPILNFIKIV